MLNLVSIKPGPNGTLLATLMGKSGKRLEVAVAHEVLLDQSRFAQAVEKQTGKRLWVEPDQEAWRGLVNFKTQKPVNGKNC